MDNITYMPLTKLDAAGIKGAAAVRKIEPGSPEAKLQKACSDFESIFVSMIMRQMMDSIPKASESVAGADLMNGLADQAVAEHIAKSGGFGLADVMYKQLSKSVLADGIKV